MFGLSSAGLPSTTQNATGVWMIGLFCKFSDALIEFAIPKPDIIIKTHNRIIPNEKNIKFLTI
jgi:hypothetical protein